MDTTQNENVPKPNKKPKKKYLARYQDDEILAESVVINGTSLYALVGETKIDLVAGIGNYHPIGNGLGRGYIFKNNKEFDDILEEAKHQTLDSLYTALLKEWNKYSCAPPFHNELCAADTIYTYFQDMFGMTHYIFFIGSPDSGKSNKLTIFNILGYRNFMSVDMTAANIYRHLGCEQECQGTLCEDEGEELDDEREKMRLYKAGYVRGTRVPRNDKEDMGSLEQKGYFTYGFKAFSAEQSPDSTKAKGFNTRTIPLNCISDIPKYDLSEVLNPAGTDKFILLYNSLFELRNLLFCYKLLHCRDEFPDIELNITNREKQLFKPLLRLFQGTKTQTGLLKVVSHFVNERRKASPDTLLSTLYNIIANLVENNGQVITCKEIWERIKLGIDGSEIPGRPMSWDTSEFGVISQKKILAIIKDNFGAKPPKRHGTERSLEFDHGTITKLNSKYTVADIEVGTDGTDGTDGTHFQEKEGTMPDDVCTPISSSSYENDNNVSHASQNTQIEHEFDPSKVGRFQNNASQCVPKLGDLSQNQGSGTDNASQVVNASQNASQTNEADVEDGGRVQRVRDRYESIS